MANLQRRGGRTGRKCPFSLIAAAYAYCEGEGDKPDELQAFEAVEQFGAQAVFGRVMGAGEIRRMMVAHNVVQAYESRAQADNWSEWASQYPKAAELLNMAARLTDVSR